MSPVDKSCREQSLAARIESFRRNLLQFCSGFIKMYYETTRAFALETKDDHSFDEWRGEVDEYTARLLGLPPVKALESKTFPFCKHDDIAICRTFIMFERDPPRVLGSFGDLSTERRATITLVRAEGHDGRIYCYTNFECWTFSRGWYSGNPGNNTDGLFRFTLLNQQGGILVEWRLRVDEMTIGCYENGRRRFVRRDLHPDIYDEAGAGRIWYPDRGWFHPCYKSEPTNGPE